MPLDQEDLLRGMAALLRGLRLPADVEALGDCTDREGCLMVFTPTSTLTLFVDPDDVGREWVVTTYLLAPQTKPWTEHASTRRAQDLVLDFVNAARIESEVFGAGVRRSPDLAAAVRSPRRVVA